MAILVTGGLGYIGSHVVKMLKEQGEEVVIVDFTDWKLWASSGCVSFKIDICSKARLRDIFNEYNIEAVVHLAAYADVEDSIFNPHKYYVNNVAKSLALIEVMMDFECNKFIFSSSAAVYGDPQTIPMCENHRRQPVNPYGASKLMLEDILEVYREIYKFRSISFRYFNAAGADPGHKIGEAHEPEHHIIPLLLQDAPVKIFGSDWNTPDGTCIRDFVHVNDIAQAHVLALQALRGGSIGRVYNIGSGTGYSILQLIEAVEKVTGKKVDFSYTLRRLGDPGVLVASNESIKHDLGWSPEYTDLESIIDTAWQWHRNQ